MRLIILLILLTVGAPAAAGPEPDAAALNDQAITLSKQGAYAEAIEVWWRILEREGPGYAHAAVIHRNIGRNYQKLGAPPEARWHLNEAVRATDKPNPKALAWLEEVEEVLAAEHLEVLIDVEGTGGEILLEEGGKLRGYPEPLAWWFRPGTYAVTVRARDGALRQHHLRIAPGRTRYVLPARAAATQPKKDPPVEPPPPTEAPQPRPSRWAQVPAWTWALVGGGAAAVIAGGATWAVADARLADLRGDFRQDHPPEDRTPATKPGIQAAWDDAVQRDVEPLEYSSYALWGLGGAALATGTTLLVLELVGEDTSKPGPRVTPTPGGLLVDIPF